MIWGCNIQYPCNELLNKTGLKRDKTGLILRPSYMTSMMTFQQTNFQIQPQQQHTTNNLWDSALAAK